MHLVVILFLLAFVPQAVNAQIINVPDDFETIQEAIRESEHGDTILVQPGRYNESLDFMGRRIVLASRFFTEGDEQYIEETIIDANGLDDRVVKFDTNENEESQLIGFTITGGDGSFGGGIYCNNATPVLTDLYITDNYASSSGGGVYCTAGAAPTLVRCSIINNASGGYGGGAYCRRANVHFERCVVAYNECEEWGGGVYCTSDAEPMLVNLTIYGNAAGEGRGGLHAYGDAMPTLVNCIHWDNDPGDINEDFQVTYSDMQGGYDGQGNIDDDPELAAPEDGDFGLTRGSPCIDEGDPDSPEDPDGTRADMGAVYYAQTPLIEVDPRAIDFGETNAGLFEDRNLAVSNEGAAALHIESIELVADDESFIILEGGEAVDLEEDQDHIVSIRFQPQQQGELEASIVIRSDDPENGELTVNLQGVGLAPVPDIDVEPLVFHYEETVAHRTSTQNLAIVNVGHTVLNIDDLEITGDNPECFSVDFDDEIQVAIDEEIQIEVNFIPRALGELSGSLIVHSDDPDEAAVEIRLNGTGILPEEHYDPIENTGVNHSLLVLEATINEEVLGVGSEIAVFTPAGLCCGSAVWLGARAGFAAWGDNQITEDVVDGFREEEEFDFRFWDAVTEQEINAVPDWVQGDEIYMNNGVSVLNLAGEGGEPEPDEFVIHLAESWNLISAPLIPETDNVIELWQPVVDEDNLDLLKDYLGRFYYPQFGFCGIPRWDYHQGYQAKIVGETSLALTGEFVEEDAPIQLPGGWSMAAYFPEANVPAPVAFANIEDDLLIAKDGIGRFYLPAFGFSNMGNLGRGFGYQVQTENAVEFVWNVPNFLNSAGNEEVRIDPQHFSAQQPTGKNMSLLIASDGILEEPVELGVFASGNICIGGCILNGEGPWGTALWGDDMSTGYIDGAAENEALSFRIWAAGREDRISVEWIHGDGQYRTDSFGVISLSSEIEKPKDYVLAEPYPNPFNSYTEIKFALPEAGSVNITVHDLTGREIQTIASGFQTAGWHKVVWKADGVASGIYVIRMQARDKNHFSKVSLIR